MSRQSIGEFCSWLHNCGEPWCPFGESTSALREQLRNQGLAYEPAIGRTLSEVPVDNRAFPEPVYVQVKLDLLGYDPNNWGGLEYFSGEITHRFYHAVTGHPCFEVDFGGCIGVREVLVANTRVHAQRQYGHHLADIPGTSSPTSHGGDVLGDATGAPIDRIYTAVRETSDSDFEWRPSYRDFHSPGHSGTSSDMDCFHENALLELGLYDVNEETEDWSAEDMWDDSQWQEQNLELLQDTENFSGLTPGPVGEHSSSPWDTFRYFKMFWPVDVRMRIISETNR